MAQTLPRHKAVVEAPAHVPLAGSRIPPGVGAGCLGVEMAEGINPAIGKEAVHPGTFLRQEAGIVPVSLWMRDIQLLVSGVDIAHNDEAATALDPGIHMALECFVEGQLVGEASRTRSPVWEVDVV